MIRANIIRIILTLIMLGMVQYSFAQDEIICATLKKYPYTTNSIYDGPDGFCVRIFELAARESGIKVDLYSGTYDVVIDQLNNGNVDCIPFMNGSRFNEDNFEVSPINLLVLWGGLITVDTNIVKNISDLENKKVGFINEDVCSKSYIEFVQGSNTNITPVWYDNFLALEKDIANHIISAGFVSDYIVTGEFDPNLVKSPVVIPPVRISFGFRKGGFSRISDSISKSIELMKRNPKSKFYQILKQYRFSKDQDGASRIKSMGAFFSTYLGAITIFTICLISLAIFLTMKLVKKRAKHRRFASEFDTLHYFYENLTVPLIIHKVDHEDSHYIMMINKAAHSLFKQDVGSWSFDDYFVLVDSDQPIGKYIEELELDKPRSFAVRLRDDKKYRNKYEFTTQLMQSGDRAFTFIDNYTEEVEMLESLQDSQYALEMATESGKVGVFELELPSMIITGSNQLFVNLGIDYAEEGITYSEFLNLVIYNNHLSAQKSLDELIKGERKNCSIEFKIVSDDGEATWMRLNAKAKNRDKAGKAKTLVGVVINIDQIKKLNLKLEGLSRNFELLMDNSPDVIYFKNLDLEFTWVSLSCANVLGTNDRSSVVGKNDFDFHSNEIAQEFYDLEKEVVSNGERIINYEQSYIGVNGKNEWMLSTKVPINNSDGEIVGLLGMAKNITEYKEVIDALNNSQKISSLGKLAGGIAHDFNNSLNGIMGFANLLQDRFARGSKEMEYLDFIINGTDRCAELTKHLLAFARKGKYIQAEIDMHQLINTTSILVENTFKEDVEIICKLNAQKYIVLGDIRQLESVLINMISNAENAVHGSGFIKIETQSIISDNATDNSGNEKTKPSGVLEIKISDDGEGISQENIKKIFDPFFTTRKVGEATGLGLSAAHGIVLNHNGQITVESVEGEGTCFTITLPIYEPEEV